MIIPDKFDSPLAGMVKVNFKEVDEWFEEQARVLYHPKDPFHRVDCLPTGRHVKVEVDGVVVADTGKEGGVMSLRETGFPPRWYLPRTAVCLSFNCYCSVFCFTPGNNGVADMMGFVTGQLAIPHGVLNAHWLSVQRRGIVL